MTEEYFNQLVDYYKEALTNSMVNEGSRSQARLGRVLASVSKSPNNPKRPSVFARFYNDGRIRNIRTLGRGFTQRTRNSAAEELANTNFLDSIFSDAAFQVARVRKLEALKKKGLPWTPDAGHQAHQKWVANLNKQRRSENQP